MVRRSLTLLAALTLFGALAHAQSVDEILAKHYEARGGLAKLKAVQTMRMTGRMIMGQDMEAPFVIEAKRPRNHRMEFTIQGLTGTQAYDGKTAWGVMPFGGKKDPEVMRPDQTKLMEEEADFDGALVDVKEKGNTIELVGKEQVEGADAYKLKVTLKSRDVRTIYLDAESYLQVKLVPDPRSTRSAEDRALQNRTALRLYRTLETMTFTTDALSDVRDQAQARAAGLAKGDALAKRLAAFAGRLETLRKGLVATREGRLTGEEQLREKLVSLYGAVNGFDGRPTHSQLAYMEVLDARLQKAVADFEALAAKETASLNRALAAHKLDALKPMRREEWQKRQEKG